MIYDVIVTVNAKESGANKQKTISVRVEADNAAGAKLAATNELRRKGVAEHPRSGFSIREAKWPPARQGAAPATVP